MSRWFSSLSLRAKLVVVVTALFGLVAAFVVLFFPAQQNAFADAALLQRARTVAKVLAANTSVAVNLDSAEGAQEVLHGAEVDPDVQYAMVLREDDSVFASVGEGEPPPHVRSAKVTEHRQWSAESAVHVVLPVPRTDARLLLGVSNRAAVAARRANLRTALLASLAVLVMGALVALVLGGRLARPIGELTALVQRIAEGDLDVAVEAQPGKDEVGRMSEAFSVMAQSLRRAAAESDRDRWLKTGQAELAETVRGEQELSALARSAITKLVEYLGAPIGTMYVADDDGRLRLLGSHAYTRPQDLATEIGLGDGVVGQAALARKTIVIADVPDGYIQVSSSLGQAPPKHILVAPLVYADALEGVIEVGAFDAFSEDQLAFIDTVGESLAIAINTAQARTKMGALLADTQRQAVDLTQQREELRTSNEQLRASEEELKQQREELRTANEQLQASEEKLRQQREELRTANEDLEEKTDHLQMQKAEIETQNVAIEAARAELEQKARDLELSGKYKSEFLANMSHELRTPLNSLLLLSERLADNKDGNLTDVQIESARIIHGGGKELLTIINDILDLSKVDAGKLDLRVGDARLSDIVSTLRRQFEPVAQEQGLTFPVEIASTAPAMVATDRQRVQQIVRNLLSNAFKFTKSGSVTLRVGSPNPDLPLGNPELATEVAFSVIDTGVGIPLDKRKLIFEAFHQAEGGTSRKHGGTGLGLTISRELARLLGGELHLEIPEEQGSIFTFVLPRVYRGETKSAGEQPAQSRGSRNASRRPTNGEREHGPGPAAVSDNRTASRRPTNGERERDRERERERDRDRELDGRAAAGQLSESFLPDDRAQIEAGDRAVLIIEDDRGFAQTLCHLARDKGYKVLAAGDGSSGVLLAAQHRPAAILLDLGLPDIDGLEVLDQLKYDLRTRHIPVHITSARDETPAALQKGAIGYLTKPIDVRALDEVFARFEEMAGTEIANLLIVEDDERERDSVVELLTHKGVAIDVAGDGASAIDRMRSKQYDCVVLDLRLPDISGLELVRKLGAAEEIVVPPIVVHTAKDLSPEEYAELSHLPAAVVVKSASSAERLLDEVSLFLHSVESSLPESQRKIIRALHDRDKLLHGRKVLLVDDDLRNTFALANVLRDAGIEVTIAYNGALALERLGSEPDIELVLMDIMMPVMDGLEAMEKIRAQPRFRRLPMLAVTARAMPEDRAKCFAAGANDYLTKPVDPDKLLSLLRVWLFQRP